MWATREGRRTVTYPTVTSLGLELAYLWLVCQKWESVLYNGMHIVPPCQSSAYGSGYQHIASSRFLRAQTWHYFLEPRQEMCASCLRTWSAQMPQNAPLKFYSASSSTSRHAHRPDVQHVRGVLVRQTLHYYSVDSMLSVSLGEHSQGLEENYGSMSLSDYMTQWHSSSKFFLHTIRPPQRISHGECNLQRCWLLIIGSRPWPGRRRESPDIPPESLSSINIVSA